MIWIFIQLKVRHVVLDKTNNKLPTSLNLRSGLLF